MFEDVMGPFLERIKEMGTPAPGGWGTTVTPTGGPTSPVNAGGIGDAFLANLKQENAGQQIGKAVAQGLQGQAPPAPAMTPPQGQDQAQMGQNGLAALRAMVKPIGSMPSTPGTSAAQPQASQGPFMMAPRSIY